jgi:two-component system sensor histidine kinase/response regulator
MRIADFAEDPRSTTRSSDAVSARTLAQVSVLVAEDNLDDQQVVRGVLESLGYAVELVRDGLQAVAAVTAVPGRFAAVLMDCRMPRMDGYEATQVIRQLEQPGAHVPVIAMTATTLLGERAHCLGAGMDEVLYKPLDPDSLASTLVRAARARQAPVTLPA